MIIANIRTQYNLVVFAAGVNTNENANALTLPEISKKKKYI